MNVSFKREPVAWVFAIKACLVVAISYGLPMTTEQLGFVVVALEAIGALIVRQNVYSPTDAQGQPVAKKIEQYDQFAQIVKANKASDEAKAGSETEREHIRRLMRENEELVNKILYPKK